MLIVKLVVTLPPVTRVPPKELKEVSVELHCSWCGNERYVACATREWTSGTEARKSSASGSLSNRAFPIPNDICVTAAWDSSVGGQISAAVISD